MNVLPIAAHQETKAGVTPSGLEIVVPFTNVRLTRAALKRARLLGTNLHCNIRLIRVQIAPYPAELSSSPTMEAILRAQLLQLDCAAPLLCEIRVARDYVSAVLESLRPHSLVILASQRRLWKTIPERLAARLRRAGHEVVVDYLEGQNA